MKEQTEEQMIHQLHAMQLYEHYIILLSKDNKIPKLWLALPLENKIKLAMTYLKSTGIID